MADKKVWLMEDVNPWEYETVNGVKRLKDWAQGELEARLAKAVPEDVEATERAIAQRKSLSLAERNRPVPPVVSEIVADMCREAMNREKALDAGLILPPA